jgi:hypothetical protein
MDTRVEPRSILIIEKEIPLLFVRFAKEMVYVRERVCTETAGSGSINAFSMISRRRRAQEIVLPRTADS